MAKLLCPLCPGASHPSPTQRALNAHLHSHHNIPVSTFHEPHWRARQNTVWARRMKAVERELADAAGRRRTRAREGDAGEAEDGEADGTVEEVLLELYAGLGCVGDDSDSDSDSKPSEGEADGQRKVRAATAMPTNDADAGDDGAGEGKYSKSLRHHRVVAGRARAWETSVKARWDGGDRKRRRGERGDEGGEDVAAMKRRCGRKRVRVGDAASRVARGGGVGERESEG